MTQQDTQPPAETLADREAIARIIAPEAMKSLDDHRAEWTEWAKGETIGGDGPNRIDIPKMIGIAAQDDYDRAAGARHRALSKADAILAALTRRAGGDAIPAGWQLVPIALPDEMAIAGAKGRQNSAISSFRDGWKYALAATPKPPAGGDAIPEGEAEAFRRGAEAMQRKLADALRDHLNSRAAAIANAVAIPEYQA